MRFRGLTGGDVEASVAEEAEAQGCGEEVFVFGESGALDLQYAIDRIFEVVADS